MKVLYCDLEYDYGVQANGLNHIGKALRKAFVDNNCEVSNLFFDDFIKVRQPSSDLQNLILQKAEEEKPDLIFFPMFTFQFSFSTLDSLKKAHKTIAWFGDDTWRFEKYSKRYAPHFTWCVTTDKFSLEKYHAAGQPNVVLSQWAAIDDESSMPEFDGNYNYEVSFVGQYNHYRAWFVRMLEKSGVKVDCFGRGWPNGSISSEKMSEVFLRSKINLNIANSLCHDLRFVFSRPVNLARYFYFPKSMGQIKARNFEIPYYGGFQLTDYFPGIEDYLIPGKEIACYKDVDEAALLIKYYLNREDLRKEVTNRSCAIARENHGYFHRVRDILKTVCE